jgi:hypothetical protein
MKEYVWYNARTDRMYCTTIHPSVLDHIFKCLDYNNHNFMIGEL